MGINSKRKLETVNTNYTCAQNFVTAPFEVKTHKNLVDNGGFPQRVSFSIIVRFISHLLLKSENLKKFDVPYVAY